jgi:hypothetical protein
MPNFNKRHTAHFFSCFVETLLARLQIILQSKMLARVIFLSLMVTLQFDHVVAWLARATTVARHGALKLKKTVVEPVVALYSTSSKTWDPDNGDDLGLLFASKNNVSVSSNNPPMFSLRLNNMQVAQSLPSKEKKEKSKESTKNLKIGGGNHLLSHEQHSLKAIPASIADFKTIRDKSYLYVDKTKILFDEILDVKYNFIARPRRFGKSLICSTLRELFSGEQSLFKGLYIHDKWDFKAEERPVIHLDMSGLSMGTTSPQDVMDSLCEDLLSIASDYEVEIPSGSAAAMFRKLIKGLRKKYKKEVVVIIDEYDAPIHHFMSEGLKVQTEMTKRLGDFYGVLKSSERELRLVYITGILRLLQMSLFSKLNNLYDHTFTMGSSSVCGYTRDEIVQNFKPHLDKLTLKMNASSLDDAMAVLQSKYNGYHFGYDNLDKSLGDGIFNPFEINHCLNLMQLTNTWVNSGGSKVLVDKILQQINSKYILRDAEIHYSTLDSHSIDEMSLEGLEYFAGYSTIKEVHDDGMLTLGPPNANIQGHIARSLARKLWNDADEKGFSKDLQVMLKHLHDQNVADFGRLLHKCMMSVPHQIFRNLHEKEARYNLVTSLFLQIAASLEHPNWQCLGKEISTATGDIEIVMKEIHSNTVFIFEYKLNRSPAVALKQIRDKGFPHAYEGSKVVLVGINFKKKSKKPISGESSDEFVVEVEMQEGQDGKVTEWSSAQECEQEAIVAQQHVP